VRVQTEESTRQTPVERACAGGGEMECDQADINRSSSSSSSTTVREFTGTEAFLVGLAPTYWSHVPLHIGQLVNGLILQNGLHCLPVLTTSSESRSTFSDNNPKLVPLTRCKLVGRIIAADRKGGGCVQYLIDDGTGLVDCLYWGDQQEEDGGLPSLTLKDETHLLPIGELVCVFGKIQCTDVTEALAANDAKSKQQQRVLREIHTSMVQPFSSLQSRRAQPYSMDPEWQHWIDCIRIQEQFATNANDVLQWLGPEITKQVADQSNLPSADDTVGAWRLFGSQCPCGDDNRVKQELLYCHCIATAESMDPNFAYRDGLLSKLLSLEHEQALSGNEHDHNRRDEAINGDETSKQPFNYHPLRFSYQALFEDEELNQIAKQEVVAQNVVAAGAASGGTSLAAQVQQLVRNTVRALRQDGILHLEDREQDVYLFVSRRGVLAPYIYRSLECKDNLERTKFHSDRPDFLNKVPRARVQLVKRIVHLEQQEREGKCPMESGSSTG